MKGQKIEGMFASIKSLYSIVLQLQSNFPGRPFTPDGHLVGSIGEVLASYYYGLELLPPSTEIHDATISEKNVQIKATQSDGQIGLCSEPDYLLVIKILQDGSIDEIYNGPGHLAWQASGKMQKNGQRQIRVNTLKELMKRVQPEMRIQKLRS